MIAAAQEEFHFRRRVQLLDQLRGVLALAHRGAVRVLLPAVADVVAMAEEALVAVDVLGNRLADVIRLRLLAARRQRTGQRQRGPSYRCSPPLRCGSCPGLR